MQSQSVTVWGSQSRDMLQLLAALPVVFFLSLKQTGLLSAQRPKKKLTELQIRP